MLDAAACITTYLLTFNARVFNRGYLLLRINPPGTEGFNYVKNEIHCSVRLIQYVLLTFYGNVKKCLKPYNIILFQAVPYIAENFRIIHL